MGAKRAEVKEQLTARILPAALSEFAEKGYAGATLKGIAARAEVSNGVISKYFETKEGLLMTLIKKNTLAGVFAGLAGDEPEDVFNYYIDFIKHLLKNRPSVFQFYYKMFNDSELTGTSDSAVNAYLWQEFGGSRLERAMIRAQSEGELPGGDPLKIYRLLVHTTFEILAQYSSIGLPIPGNSFILAAIQFAPGEKSRRRFVEEKEKEVRGLSKDLRLMASTINRLFPLSIYSNLTKNRYHMLDYDDFYARKAAYAGTYDDLIAAGMSTVEDETDRENFGRVFSRQALLDSFSDGQDTVGLIHTQTGDDKIVRIMYTRALLSKDENGDILAISVAYELPEYLLEHAEYRREIEKFNRKIEGKG